MSDPDHRPLVERAERAAAPAPTAADRPPAAVSGRALSRPLLDQLLREAHDRRRRRRLLDQEADPAEPPWGL